jgi:hypothetical protein
MTEWQIVAEDTDVNGAVVKMRYAEFGKGRSKIKKWELLRDGEKVGYAVNAGDAEVNFARVKSGLTRNTETGFYE